MRTTDFHYDLPPELIAQSPVPQRDASRLLVLHRADGRVEHRRFGDLPGYLRAGDVIVLNNSRVIPARLRGWKPASGGEVEVLLVEENRPNDWWVMLRPGKRVRAGTQIQFRPGSNAPGLTVKPEPPISSVADGGEPELQELAAVVQTKNEEGLYRLRFEGPADVRQILDRFGEVALPPYIVRSGTPSVEDRERYQTVFARAPGSVAAPTAGLHLTEALLDRLKGMGVEVCFVTLHVGLGTFAPVKAARLEDHVMHEEAFELPSRTAAIVSRAKAEGRRVMAVGTTSVRVLETVAAQGGLTGSALSPSDLPGGHEPLTRPSGTLSHRMGEGWGEGGIMQRTGEGSLHGRTRLFLRPPARFQVVDALLTNFHLPESTLLMLACAFAAPGTQSGRDLVLHAYAEAIQERYRFFSYGDAMLIL